MYYYRENNPLLKRLLLTPLQIMYSTIKAWFFMEKGFYLELLLQIL